MSRRFPGLLLLLLALTPLAVRAQDDIIHPRGTVPAGAPAAAPASGLNSLFLLGTAAACAGAGWWLWQKRRAGAAGGAPARLAIVESRPLGSRQYLVVAEYEGKKFLLGVCPGSIEMLTPLDGGKPPAP
jgi:flagellar protein FliO/FliZ